MPESRLTVQDLRVILTGTETEVLSGVGFSVAPGEILGLVGESGSGKTTAGLALLGYARRGLTIAGGSVTIDGNQILGIGQSSMRRMRGSVVAYVPQDPSSALNPGMRIGAQLREAILAHNSGMPRSQVRQRIEELLGQVHLEGVQHVLRAFPHQISGGQQQRAGIAMAFSCHPSVIVLDEPTTGLDVSTQSHVIDTVASLCASEGASAVYVSHDLAVVRQLAQRVAVMYSGRIVEMGTTASLFDNPRHPYTRGLLAAAPTPERRGRLVGLEGSPPRVSARLGGCTFAPRCDRAVAACSVSEPVLSELEAGHAIRCIRPVTAAVTAAPVPLADNGRPQDNDSLLQVGNLVAGYGSTEVLHGVSLSIAPRECVAVVGESGSGKTTLARCVIGLHSTFTAGELSFAGQSLTRAARSRTLEQRRGLQYVFQNPYGSLNPRRTVGQSIVNPIKLLRPELARSARDLAVAALEDVSLTAHYFDRYPDELSGGERQRAAIARALVVEPQILICDEVTSSLDVSVQAVVIETLRQLQETQHLAMLFITHNIALVRSIAQSVVVMSEGRVVEQGDVESVITAPSDPYTSALLRDVPKLSA